MDHHYPPASSVEDRHDTHRTSVHITFNRPVFILVGAILLPFVVIGLYIFCVHVVTDYRHFEQVEVPTIMEVVYGTGVFLIVGSALYAVLLCAGRAYTHIGTHRMDMAERASRIRITEALPFVPEQALVEHAKSPYNVTTIIPEKYNYNIRMQQQQGQLPPPEEVPGSLPRYVRYREIQPYIPRGHALVGVAENCRPVTKLRDDIRGLVWVVGGSNTGKSNTVTLRADEDYERGHLFLGIDPHASKPDSLYHATRGYASSFLLPMARSTEESIEVAERYLAEGNQRVQTGQWDTPLTLLVDETGRLTSFLETDEDKQLARLLKEIARFCGQEARGFDMCAVFISQNAAGLSWLRRDAGMVIAHQVNTFSERLLVCNQDRIIARQMDTWPKGRTFIYGLGIEEGPGVYQQPVLDERVGMYQQPMRRNVWDYEDSSPVQTEEYDETVSTSEIVDETSSDAMFQRFQMIREMRETGKKSKVEILKTVYGVKPGATKAYKEAEAEYNQFILQEDQHE